MMNRRNLLKMVPIGIAGSLFGVKKVFAKETTQNDKVFNYRGIRVHQSTFIYPKEDFDDEKYVYDFAVSDETWGSFLLGQFFFDKNGKQFYNAQNLLTDDELYNKAVFPSQRDIDNFVKKEIKIYRSSRLDSFSPDFYMSVFMREDKPIMASYKYVKPFVPMLYFIDKSRTSTWGKKDMRFRTYV